MNFSDFYTDTVDVFRSVEKQYGALTRQEREQVFSGVPCRIYQSGMQPLNMSDTTAYISQNSKLMLSLDVLIQAGDELHIHRGKVLGSDEPVLRAFASRPNCYYEPFGAVMPGLAHQEVSLLQQERVKEGGVL